MVSHWVRTEYGNDNHKTVNLVYHVAGEPARLPAGSARNVRGEKVPMVQMDERCGSWQEAVAAKFLTHSARPDPQGNADMGRTIARAIESM